MSGTTDLFYNELSGSTIPLHELLKRDSLFSKIPTDWHVVITDVKGSTKAVLNGQHETINLIATGSIVSVLNFVFKQGIAIPFFFGGDGATFIVPPSVKDVVMQLLIAYKENTMANFNLELRVGTLPVKQIYEQGHELRMSKFNISPAFSIPLVLGSGLNYAEQLIKAEDYLFNDKNPLSEELDLTGMQCRWDKIGPPENSNEIVTLLIIAKIPSEQAMVFSKIMQYLDQIYGDPKKRQPISVAKLKLKTTFNRLGLEMRAKIGKIRFFELIQTWLINLYGYIYLRTESGQYYLNKLVEMSDTLVVDGKINTVISGTESQRVKLVAKLDEMEKEGKIFYGLHVSNDAIMSCYVRDLVDGHVHFVDGSEGGYTQAAMMLKVKLIH